MSVLYLDFLVDNVPKVFKFDFQEEDDRLSGLALSQFKEGLQEQEERFDLDDSLHTFQVLENDIQVA